MGIGECVSGGSVALPSRVISFFNFTFSDVDAKVEALL